MTLRLLRRLFAPRPPPSRPPASGNPILDWLDGAGLPWRLPRAELAARFGVSADNPYRWDLVCLDVSPPPLSGLLRPFSVQMSPRFSPLMPPGSLSAHVHVGDDAERNIRAAASQFSAALGRAAVVDRYNTRAAEWRSGAASVSLVAWPPARQTQKLDNPAHRRDGRLATSCSVTIQTGWRPPLSARERGWLDGFAPMGATAGPPPVQARAPGTGWYKEAELEFTRAPPADVARFRGRFGLSADRAALIFCDDALYVIGLSQVVALAVARTLPAKGGGGSRLTATCRTGYAACPLKEVQVAQGEGPEDLNEAGAALAAACRKPFTLGEHDYDV